MEDFLKDRPTVDATPPAAASAGTESESAAPPPFKALERTVPAAATASAPAAGEPAAQAIASEDGARVETVVEGGRVTKIIVTCSCGKVTEVACRY